MAKDWEYAQASKWIAEHGGPKVAMEAVKNFYLKEGYQRGARSKNPVIVLVGTTCLAIGIGGKYAYDKIVEKRKEKAANKVAELEKVNQAEAELLAAMKQEPTAETTNNDEKDIQTDN